MGDKWDETLRPFPRAETFLDGRANDDLPMLALTEYTSDLLGVVLQELDLPKLEGEPSDHWMQTRALLYLGVLAARSLRAMMALLRLGYDAEALIFQRRLSEIHARVQRCVDEKNGAQHARDWLEGKDSTAARVIELPQGAWELLSHVAHADYRAVEHHLVTPRDDGLSNFMVLPLRRTEVANAMLVLNAGHVRDVANLIAFFAGVEINDLAKLDAELDAASAHYLPDPDDAEA